MSLKISSMRPAALSAGFCLRCLVWLALAGLGFSARAQWLTQTNVIKPGWSAVYFNVDASSQNLTNLITYDPSDPIDQIWLWKAQAGTAQYLSSPASPYNTGIQWARWLRNTTPTSPANTLAALIPNAAYMIHSTATTNYTWRVQGQPVPPSFVWDMTGLNFIGFPTPYATPPSFLNFFAQDPAIASVVQIYQFVGGPFSTLNPQPVFSQYTTPVVRGQAYWVSATNVNNTYFGPFSLTLPNAAGLNYGGTVGQMTLQLVNVTSNTLTVSVKLLASETPPYGQTNIVAPPPMLIEGALNASNLTYAYTALGTAGTVGVTNCYSWTLAPSGQSGSDLAVTFGINRFALTTAPGSLYAGILQFSDSLGFSEVDVPVSANSANNAGLWVGKANVSQVGSYLKTYATNADGSLVINTFNTPSYTTNYVPFATTDQVISNFFTTNVTVNYNDQTNEVVDSYSDNFAVITTNSFVIATNLTVTTYNEDDTVVDTEVLDVTSDAGGNVLFITTNIVSTVWTQDSATTNYTIVTNSVTATGAGTRVLVTGPFVLDTIVTNESTANQLFADPVTTTTGVTSSVTNSTRVTTNVVFNLVVTNQSPTVTSTNYTTVSLSVTTNTVITGYAVTNFIATNTALTIFTNHALAISVNPLVNYYWLTNLSAIAYNTNSVVINNNFTVTGGVTNYTGSTTSVLYSASSSSTPAFAATNYVKNGFQLVTNAAYLVTTNIAIGSYTNFVVTGVNTNLGAVPAPFPLRLIVFNDGTNSSLLQRVYYGLRGETNIVVATTETVLDVDHLNTARRISCVNMPWTADNNPIAFSGQLVLGGTLSATYYEDYGDQAANPFLHTFHPDHNNLDLTQTPPRELPVGSQSYDITHQVTLTVLPDTTDFLSLTRANSVLSGDYQETITLTGLGGATRTFTTAGTFSLTSLSPISTLTTQ